MEITHTWLMSVASDRGGWTRAQLALLGVAWPPRPGWKRWIEGTHISDALAAKVEAGRKGGPRDRGEQTDLFA